LAEDHGRSIRDTIASPEYQAVFGTTLSPDSTARGSWHTAEGGSFFAVGVGGHLFGRGANVLIVDDAFGSAADARSELQRKNVHDWFSSVHSRLEPGAIIIVIASRLHEDDLTGRLLAEHGDEWKLIEMPAIGDDGSALWPERFDVAALERIRDNVTSFDWMSLYQQRPIRDEGSYFKDEWIRPVVDPPPLGHLHCYGASDFAVTSDGGDYTVHVVLGIDPKNRMFLLDLWREQTSSAVWVESWCDLVRKYKPQFWAFEKGSITSGVGPFLETRARARQAWTCRELFPTRGDKAIRCQSIRGRMELGGLYVPAGARWLPELRAELLGFPQGKHDDQVDALGLVGQLLDKWSPGIRPPPKTRSMELLDRAWMPRLLEENLPSFKTM
jgi:predicted phage terminase large subunit-like protein